MATHVLLVEDEESYRETLEFSLSRDGYTVESVGDGISACEKIDKGGFDIILLDVMLPGMNGIDVCKYARTRSHTPIIMISALSEEIDKIIGLEVGADDYVTKPYSYRELHARMRAVLRRSETNEEENDDDVLSVGSLTMDTNAHSVMKNGEEIFLPLREYELLELFMRNSGRVLPRTLIFDRLWGENYVGDTKTLDVHIKRLRSRIEDDPSHPRVIETVRGLGYKMNS